MHGITMSKSKKKIGIKSDGLFDDVIVSRPRIYDKKIVKKAATIMANRICDYFISDDEPSEVFEDERDNLIEFFIDNHHLVDGYELAKHLEYEGWVANAELVNELDGLYLTINGIHRECVKGWVDEFHVRPALEKGDRIEFVLKNNSGHNYESDTAENEPMHGVIRSIHSETGEYSVDTEDGHCMVYPFEDVFYEKVQQG